MRVPVYQQQVTPQIPSVRTQVQVPDGATGVALQPIDTSRGITQGIEGLRAGLVTMQENRDKFMLASAVNEFRRANMQFLHAKDTGIFAKKGKDVFGSSEQYEEYAGKTMEDIAKRYKMGGAVRERFLESTNALRNASLSSVMQHEQHETDVAQQQEWKAAISDSLSNIALAYNDDASCGENIQIAMAAAAQQWAPYGDKVMQSKMAETLSQCQMARVGAMLDADPKAAGAYLEKFKGDFTGQDYLKAKKAVDAQLDVIKVQETTDWITAKYRGREQQALQWIHKNFEGDMENKLASSVRARFGELDYKAHSASAAANKYQSALSKSIMQEVDNGAMFTPDTLAARGLDQRAITKVLAYQTSKHKWTKAESEIASSMPGGAQAFYALPKAEQERMVLAKLGTTEAQREANRATVLADVMAGTRSVKDVKTLAVYGAFTPTDADDIIETVKKFTDTQKKVISQDGAQFRTELKSLLKKFPALDETYATEQYTKAVSMIPINDAKFNEKVFNARTRALCDTINMGIKSGAYSGNKQIFGWNIPFTSSSASQAWFNTQNRTYAGSGETTYQIPDRWGGGTARIGGEAKQPAGTAAQQPAGATPAITPEREKETEAALGLPPVQTKEKKK